MEAALIDRLGSNIERGWWPRRSGGSWWEGRRGARSPPGGARTKIGAGRTPLGDPG